MKLWHKIIIALAIIALIIAGVLWWIPFHELSKGKLAIIGDTNSGRSIYLLDPLHRSWRRLPTDNLYPWYITWSPDGQKIAFTYSTSNDNDPDNVLGIAILNTENMRTQKVYIARSNEGLNVVTWTPDGQSLVFDVYENNNLTAFQKLDTQTGKLQLIPFPQNIQPQYFEIRHLEIAQNNDYVMGGWDGTYTAPPDLKNLHLVTAVGEIADFSITPDRKDIITYCGDQSFYCYYDVDTNKATKIYPEGYDYHDLGIFRISATGSWPSDEKDVIDLGLGEGEGDTSPMWLTDTQLNLEYQIDKFPHHYIMINLWGGSWFDSLYALQLAWYSGK